jgi:hypothetical protein
VSQERQTSYVSPAPSVESGFVRSYLLTGGRTRPRHLLSVDTVLASGPGRPGVGRPEESGRILDLCRSRRRSVAELAGTVGRPVNPVMVLVSDLLEDGALTVPVSAATAYAPSSEEGEDRPTRQLLEALSAGLRNKWPDAVPYPKAG